MRCWLQKMQPLMSQGPPQAWPAFQTLVGARRDAPTYEAGQRHLPHLLEQSQNPLPEAGRGLAEEAEASLNHLKVLARHRQDVRLAHTPQRF
jgi:hypothetical protein